MPGADPRFVRAVKKWRKELGLTDWDVSVEEVAARDDALASCRTNATNEAMIQVGENCRGMSDNEIEQTAVHELLHIFSSPSMKFLWHLLVAFYPKKQRDSLWRHAQDLENVMVERLTRVLMKR